MVCMIENYRTNKLWDLFMSCDEVKAGLVKLGFTYRKLMRVHYIFLFLVLALTACNRFHQTVFRSDGKVNYPLTSDEESMLDSIQHKTLLFFLNEHHPEWGIVKDRAADWAPASIASTGFGIPSFAVGVERNWMTRE